MFGCRAASLFVLAGDGSEVNCKVTLNEANALQ